VSMMRTKAVTAYCRVIAAISPTFFQLTIYLQI
jgi:hypothetical protein